VICRSTSSITFSGSGHVNRRHVRNQVEQKESRLIGYLPRCSCDTIAGHLGKNQCKGGRHTGPPAFLWYLQLSRNPEVYDIRSDPSRSQCLKLEVVRVERCAQHGANFLQLRKGRWNGLASPVLTPARPQARDRMRRQNAFIIRLTLTRCQSRDIRLAHQILTAMPTFHRVVDMACAHDSGMTMLSDGVREIVAP
jgi:hypothetical protein